MNKTPHSENIFVSADVEKLHAAVAKAHLEVKMLKNCSPRSIPGPLFEVPMSKKCTPLWRKAHLEVKMYKTPHVWSTFCSSDVQKWHAAVAKSTFVSENVQNTSAPKQSVSQLVSSSVNQSIN